jgi:hypothetical protein
LLHSLDDFVHDLREISTFDVHLDGLIGTQSVGVSLEIWKLIDSLGGDPQLKLIVRKFNQTSIKWRDLFGLAKLIYLLGIL